MKSLRCLQVCVWQFSHFFTLKTYFFLRMGIDTGGWLKMWLWISTFFSTTAAAAVVVVVKRIWGLSIFHVHLFFIFCFFSFVHNHSHKVNNEKKNSWFNFLEFFFIIIKKKFLYSLKKNVDGLNVVCHWKKVIFANSFYWVKKTHQNFFCIVIKWISIFHTQFFLILTSDHHHHRHQHNDYCIAYIIDHRFITSITILILIWKNKFVCWTTNTTTHIHTHNSNILPRDN